MKPEDIEEGADYRLPAGVPAVCGRTALRVTVDAETTVGVDYGPDVVNACEVTFLSGPLKGVGDFWVQASDLVDREG